MCLIQTDLDNWITTTRVNLTVVTPEQLQDKRALVGHLERLEARLRHTADPTSRRQCGRAGPPVSRGNRTEGGRPGAQPRTAAQHSRDFAAVKVMRPRTWPAEILEGYPDRRNAPRWARAAILERNTYLRKLPRHK